jgi:hypothetical protein
MMNRRDFVRFLGVTAAGAAALPQQIEAFEAYYDANTPMTSEPLVAVDEIWLCGMAGRSLRINATFFDDTKHELPLGINAFGGIICWKAQPDSKIVLTKYNVTWNTTVIDGEKFSDVLTGHISYIDQAKVRRNFALRDWRGSLA